MDPQIRDSAEQALIKAAPALAKFAGQPVRQILELLLSSDVVEQAGAVSALWQLEIDVGEHAVQQCTCQCFTGYTK